MIYSKIILITDSKFIMSDRTSTTCLTADLSFKTRLETGFKKEYQSVKVQFRHRSGLRGMAASPRSVSQILELFGNRGY